MYITVLIIIVGAAVLVAIDKALRIDMSVYPWWKHIMHVMAYALWGAMLAKF